MTTRLLILLGYLVAVVAIGAAGRRRARAGEEDFFLAGRTLGPLVLLATMAATNFSAFSRWRRPGAAITAAIWRLNAMGYHIRSKADANKRRCKSRSICSE